MTPEQALDKSIMLYCGQRNWLCFHINVGGGTPYIENVIKKENKGER